MKINLPVRSFTFFKTLSGAVFLFSSLLFPVVAIYSFLIALVVGKTHAIGAWLAMWRSKKLNWVYVFLVSALSLVVSFWGIKVVSLEMLSFVTSLLFAFHFVYDEFSFNEEKKMFINLISSVTPCIIIFLYLISDFFKIGLGFNLFIVVALTVIALELIFLEEINWFFIQNKIFVIFLLSVVFFNLGPNMIIGIFLVFHYLFWFVYPVYNLHKYKREERDGLIMILILLIFFSAFYASTSSSSSKEITDLTIRWFLIGTLIHIASTAPFGYFLGLPKSKYN